MEKLADPGFLPFSDSSFQWGDHCGIDFLNHVTSGDNGSLYLDREGGIYGDVPMFKEMWRDFQDRMKRCECVDVYKHIHNSVIHGHVRCPIETLSCSEREVLKVA